VASVTGSGQANSKVSGATLETGAFTCTGSNRVVYAVAFCSSATPAETTVVKHGGSSGTLMTKIGPTLTVATNLKCSVYRLINPSSSSLTVHATWAASHDERALIAFGVDGTHQSYPNGNTATATGTGTSVSITADTPSGALTIGLAMWQDGGLDLTITAGQTSIQEIEGTSNTYNGLLAEYTTSGGSTQAMTATLSGSPSGWGGFAFAVNDHATSSVPIVEASDCTDSGSNTASTSWAVNHPAFVSGDLLVFHVASDAAVTHNWPATGPNGETIVDLCDSLGDGGSPVAQRVSGFYFVGTATTGAGSVTVTPSATEQRTCTVLKVPAGEFNSTTPIQVNVGTASDSTADTSWATPSWTADAQAGGRVVVFGGHDTVTATNVPAGWGVLSAVDIGAVGHSLIFRELENSSSESIASVNVTKTSETDASFGYIINAPSAEVGSTEDLGFNPSLYAIKRSIRPNPFVPGARR
jgi:hypothetical protein